MSENNTQKLILIDPPSGWRYGFPKAITQEQYREVTSLKEWCIENGYPKEEADSYGECFHIGISGELPETNQNFGLSGGGNEPEPIYTEEEVKQLILKCQQEISFPETYYEPTESEEYNETVFLSNFNYWFNENKKK